MINFFNTLKAHFAPPVFEDEDKTRTAFYLNTVSLSAIGVVALYLIVQNLADKFDLSTLDFILFGFIGVLLAARYAMTKGYVKFASHIVVGLIWLGLAYQTQRADGIRDATFFAFFVIILMASLLLGTREMLIYSVLSVLMGIGLAYFQTIGVIDNTLDTPQNFARDITFIFVLFAIFLYLVTTSLGNALKRARSTAQELQKNNEELQALQTGLEARVVERTKALEMSADVSRRLASILDTRQLASTVVNEIRDSFNYYYVQIYLLDEAGENLVLTAGTGQAGVEMMKRGHSLPKGRGLVGRVADTKESILVSDTSQDPNWLSNELLPDTKSEAVVPIFIGNKVLGVLDVQDDVTNDIFTEDVTLLESLASQVAISLNNARQYAESLQFKLGIENSGDAVFATDAHGIITYANPGFEKVYGYSPEEAIGKNPRIIKSGLLSQESYQQFWEALLSKQPVTGEIVNKHKDGHLIYIAGTNSAIVNEAGEIVGFLAVHHDISDQRENQDLISQRARQQEAINTITQKIQSATTIEEAMQVAARELGHALGKRQTLVTLESSTFLGGEKENSNIY